METDIKGMLLCVAESIEEENLRGELEEVATGFGTKPLKISEKLFRALLEAADMETFIEWAYQKNESPICMTVGGANKRKMLEARAASVFHLIVNGLEINDSRREQLLSRYFSTLIKIDSKPNPTEHEIAATKQCIKCLLDAIVRVASQMTEAEVSTLLPTLKPEDKIRMIIAIEKGAGDNGIEPKIKNHLVDTLSLILWETRGMADDLRQEAHGIRTRLGNGHSLGIRKKAGPKSEELRPIPKYPNK